jgi:signal transduction histidine kinase
MPHPRPERADLNEIAREALATYEGRVDGVDLAADLALGLPLLVVDPEQLRRVIVNLVDNALEAVSDAAVRQVRVRTRLDASAEVVHLEVEDTGHGVDPSDRDRLFLPHFSTRKRGTGLGLAIVRHIVADHRGRVWAEPNAPAGSRFVVELPLAPASSESAAEPEYEKIRADS